MSASNSSAAARSEVLGPRLEPYGECLLSGSPVYLFQYESIMMIQQGVEASGSRALSCCPIFGFRDGCYTELLEKVCGGKWLVTQSGGMMPSVQVDKQTVSADAVVTRLGQM